MTEGKHAESTDAVVGRFDVIVIGAGIAGLYAMYRLDQLGFSARCFERGKDVGGTWYWNRYPGARCDVDSVDYSFSFSPELEQEWEWTERYPTQPELLTYFNHVADRFDLRRDIRFNTLVTSVAYDDTTKMWNVETDTGESASARFVITAAGCLSLPNRPNFKGLEAFAGRWYHTAAWPHEDVDFAGQRVAVIGTGSTGIQLIPQVAKQADQLYVLQRTPNFSVPAGNRPLDPAFQQELKARYREHRHAARVSAFGQPIEPNPRTAVEATPDECVAELDRRWEEGGGAVFLLAFADLLVTPESNDIAADYVRAKVRELVKDPETAELLCPTDHPIGTKRLCVDTDYYETYNRPNVSLVDVREAPIEEITPDGIRLADGRELAVDTIVFATGFDAVTGPLFNMNIRGKNGILLQDHWADGPHTYLGLMSAGFPNLFTVTGPHSPSVLTNMMVSIEQHVEWITDVMDHMRENGIDEIEPTTDAVDAWTAHCMAIADMTLFPRANSWWMGRNIPGKPAVLLPYVGGNGPYRARCEEIRDNGYEGFALDGIAVPYRTDQGEVAA